MSDLRVIHLTSTAELRAAAAEWDDLWWRSDAEWPYSRAELLAQWIEQFAPRAALHAVVVADRRRWIAALPLISRRLGGLIPIPAAVQPGNFWSSAGDLLLDVAAETDAAAERLLRAAADIKLESLLWLDETTPERPSWQVMLRACARARAATCCREHFRVGRVEIGRSWTDYRRRLPKSHRQGLDRALRRLRQLGEVRFEMNTGLDPRDVGPWLREAFEVENRSWKGAAGTSVLHAPGVCEFFVRQSEQLAQWNQLETAALRLDGRLLAFTLGCRAKGIYFVPKIGYDPQFAAFSPGQLLFHHIFERLHGDGRTRALDFMGPLAAWQLRWRPTTTYGLCRTIVAAAPVGRAVLLAYRRLWLPLRCLCNLKDAEVALPASPTAIADDRRRGTEDVKDRSPLVPGP